MSCPKIPERSYQLFSRRVHEEAFKSRRPLNGSFALTYRCNLSCAHCYGVVEAGRPELSTAQVYQVLDQIADAGCLWLLLTGGEPLLRQDFEEIYLYAKQKGFILTLFTNGTLITDRIADLLRDYQPFTLEISLYGATDRTYGRMCGAADGFTHCRRGIVLLRQRRVPFSLKTTVTALNQEELWEMKRLAEEELGVGFRFDAMVLPKLDGSPDPAKVRLAPETVVRLDVEDAERRGEWIEFSEKFGRPYHPRRLFACPAGEIMFDVDPYGEVRMCDIVREPHFSLLAQPFREGWATCFSEIKSRRRGDSACATCEAIPFCDICPGWSLLEKGEEEAAVDFPCRVAQMRADQFAAKV